MAQLLSPGVFIEEVPAGTNVVGPVSTSEMGIIGWTPQGPTNVATFISSFNQFVSTFGTFDSRSFVAYAMAAFFYNGGSASYVVRVTPTDAVAASAIIEGNHTGQVIETGNNVHETFTETASTTPLLVAAGIAPVTAGSFSITTALTGSAVVDDFATQRDQVTPLVEATGVLSYEGSVNPNQSVTIGTSTAALLFESVQPGATGITVQIVAASTAQSGTAASITSFATPDLTLTGLTGMTAEMVAEGLSLTVSGAASPGNNGTFPIVSFISATSVVVKNASGVATDANNGSIVWSVPVGSPAVSVTGSAIVIYVTSGTTTATQVAALVEAYQPAAALVNVYVGSTGAGFPAVTAATPLAGGLPTYNEYLPAVISKTFSVTWTATSVSKTISFATPTSTVGFIQTATNVAGSTCVLDLASGRFSLLLVSAEAPASADNGSAFQVSYTPSVTTVLAVDTTLPLVNGAGLSGILGTGLTGGGTHTSALSTPPTGTQSWIDQATGAYNLSFTAAVPLGSPLLASYKTNDWTFAPISAGAWGNNVSVQIQGSPNYFNTATQTYSRYITYILVTNSLGNTTVAESYEDLIWTTPTSTSFFADVINEFSSLVAVAEPGADEGPPQLNGILDTEVIAGGNDSNSGRVIVATLAGNPIAPNTVTIVYTDSLGVHHTITDDGNGNLIGDVDPTYVPGNTIVYTSGAVSFETVAVSGSLGIKAGTLVVATYYTSPAVTTDTVDFTGGADGTFNSVHFGRNQFSSPALSPTYQGLYALDRIEDLMQVVIPDFAGDVTVTDDLLDYADTHAASPSGGDRFIVLNVPQGSTSQTAVNWFRNSLARYSDYAALYWPWVNITDPLTTLTKTMPVVGHVCGVYARTDATRNVGKAPGGTVDGQLNFVVSLETIPSQADRNLVYPNKINPLISSPQTGMAVWGVRTISIDPQWLYINARRLFMFLEKSIWNSTFWIVFENNGPALWARIKTQIQGFLLNLFNSQYFAGSSPTQAFFVTCDNTNNTSESIAAGVVNITVGVAPNTPAEFVVFQFQQITST